MKDVVIVSAARTPIGKFGGSLASVPVAELGAVAIREALSRAGIAPAMVDEVLLGSVLTAAQGQNVARQAAMSAGIPPEAPAMTVGNVCGSGLKAVNLGAALIRAGEADVVVAGGAENMSQACYALPGGRYGYRMGDAVLVDTLMKDALTDAFSGAHMGITAERIAERYAITREEQDAFAALSQQKCEAARKAGLFADEIAPVTIRQKKGEVVFDADEYPRDGVTPEGLSALRPAFMEGGTVTAANASGINDGAAAAVLMSAERALSLGIQPMARLLSGASTGCDPAYMGLGPIYAVRKALQRANLSVSDIDLVESNEAFAAQSISVLRELSFDPSIVNVNGGAIALGHPVGASGCRILVTLLYEMRRRQVGRGVATLCVGGGMGVATVVERV